MGNTRTEELLEALNAELERRGHGAKIRMTRALGQCKNWWVSRLERGDLKVSDFFRMTHHLDLNPILLLRRLQGDAEGSLPPAGTDPSGLPEFHGPRGPMPGAVRRARRRFRKGEPKGTVGPSFLETMDRQRYEKPRETVERIRWGLDQVHLPLIPGLLAILGSTWRLLIQLDDARHALHAALEFAHRSHDPPAVGRYLQRLGYVEAEDGDLELALELAHKALCVHLRCGNTVGMGRAMVDQGVWLSRLGKAQEAIQVQRVALEWLPEEDFRYLCTALQVIGINYRELGEPQKALSFVEKARNLDAKLIQWEITKLNWLKARICSDLDNFSESVSLYSEVINDLAEVHIGDMAVAACELVAVELKRGVPAAAYRAAMGLRTLLEPFRDNRPISAAIADLLRNGQAGLNLALIQEVRQRIKGELKRQGKWNGIG